MEDDFESMTDYEKLEHAYFLYMAIYQDIYDRAVKNNTLKKLEAKINSNEERLSMIGKDHILDTLDFYKVRTRVQKAEANKKVDIFLKKLMSL